MGLIEDIKSGEIDEIGLLDYITDNDLEVAVAVAESRYATEPILDIAAHDKDREVRIAAVNNPNIGRLTLEFLCNDKDMEVAAKARNLLGRK